MTEVTRILCQRLKGHICGPERSSLGKHLFIAEKPSVAQEFAKTLGANGGRHDGYMETDQYIVTWCFGHLVTMSYPEVYDPKYKKWSFDTLPFLPSEFKYEIIGSSAKQFQIVSRLLARDDVERIYVCTDSGREGEYIYRLVELMSPSAVKSKDRRRVWIDSFTEEEIGRGIREAKPLSDYDHLASSAFLRAKEDYLMGINFSRVLTLKFGGGIADFRGDKWSAVAVGRVMTCVLGMVVRREREIRSFVKQPFYRVTGTFDGIDAEWKAVSGSAFERDPGLYKDNGFQTREGAKRLIASLFGVAPDALRADEDENRYPAALCAGGEAPSGTVLMVSRKTEKKNAPLLYNLAELQNDCSRMFKISPDETLKIAQELYEKKLTTYPRTDARVLSTAVAKEISRNIRGLTNVGAVSAFASEVLGGEAYKKIGRSRYTNDKAITDHYAIIPTGAGLSALRSLNGLSAKVYEQICRRFLAIFYPPAVYEKTAAEFLAGTEHFFANARVLKEEGYLKVLGRPKGSAGDRFSADDSAGYSGSSGASGKGGEEETLESEQAITRLASLRKGQKLPLEALIIREGETKPPSRYNSGSIILAMENAGQLIEDEELREQIKGSGIGTSATRAEILSKLVRIGYLNLNKKTQIITPELLGEMVYDVVDHSIKPLLNAELTASWEKGLTGVAEGSISTAEYMEKLEGFVARRTNAVKGLTGESAMKQFYAEAAKYYKGKSSSGSRRGSGRRPSAKKDTKAKRT